MFRKLAFVVVAVYSSRFSSNLTQAYLGVWILLISFVLNTTVAPYKDKRQRADSHANITSFFRKFFTGTLSLNGFQNLSQGCVLVTLILGQSLTLGESENPTFKFSIQLLVLLLNGLMTVSFLAAITLETQDRAVNSAFTSKLVSAMRRWFIGCKCVTRTGEVYNNSKHEKQVENAPQDVNPLFNPVTMSPNPNAITKIAKPRTQGAVL